MGTFFLIAICEKVFGKIKNKRTKICNAFFFLWRASKFSTPILAPVCFENVNHFSGAISAAGGCQPFPWLRNTDVTFGPDVRTANLNCATGHRFPDGQTTGHSVCNDTGAWDVTVACKGRYSIFKKRNFNEIFMMSFC